jgi:hypothetical protein
MSDYYHKYLKYKQKYIELKEIEGGANYKFDFSKGPLNDLKTKNKMFVIFFDNTNKLCNKIGIDNILSSQGINEMKEAYLKNLARASSNSNVENIETIENFYFTMEKNKLFNIPNMFIYYLKASEINVFRNFNILCHTSDNTKCGTIEKSIKNIENLKIKLPKDSKAKNNFEITVLECQTANIKLKNLMDVINTSRNESTNKTSYTKLYYDFINKLYLYHNVYSGSADTSGMKPFGLDLTEDSKNIPNLFVHGGVKEKAGNKVNITDNTINLINEAKRNADKIKVTDKKYETLVEPVFIFNDVNDALIVEIFETPKDSVLDKNKDYITFKIHHAYQSNDNTPAEPSGKGAAYAEAEAEAEAEVEADAAAAA